MSCDHGNDAVYFLFLSRAINGPASCHMWELRFHGVASFRLLNTYVKRSLQLKRLQQNIVAASITWYYCLYIAQNWSFTWRISSTMSRISHQRCSIKKGFLKISQKFTENTCARVSFLIKLKEPEACNFIQKETLAQVFSCEFCGISKNTFTEHLRTTTSKCLEICGKTGFV